MNARSTKPIRGSARAFTLLEVVIALAMLAVIAVPAIGLATMAVSRNKQQLVTSNATELKNRIDVAMRSYAGGSGENVFTEDFTSAANFAFIASENLNFIEVESGPKSAENDGYYRVSVMNPIGYSQSNSYRIVTYKVVWPSSAEVKDQRQLYFTAVFRK